MVQLTNVVKVFDNSEAVNDVSIDILEGEFLTLLGPSGCGKTTTLRMIAGFEQPTSGSIFLDGEDVSWRPPYKRNVNTVFQNYALFPHLNIYNNIAFGLKMKKTLKEEVMEKVNKMLKMVQLEGYEKRMPTQLSGGQKQRVAIARALVNNPNVLLLDEPLGALDLKLRKQMQFELKHLQKKTGITFIYVTHDQEEALTMSDRIAVMNKGKMEQIGTPDEIYELPKTKFVADFIGETNLFEGEITEVNSTHAKLSCEGYQIEVENSNLAVGEKICAAIRPERLKLEFKPLDNCSFIKGKLKERIYVGSTTKTVVLLESGKEVIINETAGDIFRINESQKENIFVNFLPENAVVIKP